MRMAFGLVSILVTLGVIIMIMHFITLPNIKQAAVAQKKTKQTLGALTSGGVQDSRDSIVLDPLDRGGRFDSLIVRSIVTGGAMEACYHLVANDVIVGVNGLKFDATANGDSEMAEALIWEARGRQQPLMVVRNGVLIDLPWQAPPEPGANTGPGAAGDDASLQRESPLSRQIKIATH